MSSTAQCLNKDQSNIAGFLVDRWLNELFNNYKSVSYPLPVLTRAPIRLL